MNRCDYGIELNNPNLNFAKVLPFVAITILIAIPFGLGKYIEFNSPCPFDSAAYVYSAEHIISGAEIGVDEKPSAQSGTLLMNMLGAWLFGFSDVGPKVIQMILQIAALVMMFFSMRKLYGLFAASFGVIMAAVYLSAPVIAKNGNVKEQYMIAFMVLGISCFVFRQLEGRWWLALLAGAFASWAPLFKQTGISAGCSIVLFVIIQLFLKTRTIKQTGVDLLLLIAGLFLAVGPVWLWLINTSVSADYLPYSFAWKILPWIGSSTSNSYITNARQLLSFSQQWPMVFRNYGILILPITLAVASIMLGIFGSVFPELKKLGKEEITISRFVFLFAVWWLLDMAFVWISPRSYEQYYLPLNASSAMLAGYIIFFYAENLKISQLKLKWIITGCFGLIFVVIACWPIFFGISKSPYFGTDYGQRRKGYMQKLEEISLCRNGVIKAYWQRTGEYIRFNSVPSDRIYVWGWLPGVYVSSQRLSCTPMAFFSEMHVVSPKALSEMVTVLLEDFQKSPPKFIVDSCKNHFPWNRPPLELWPKTSKGFLSPNEQTITEYDAQYFKELAAKFGLDEAFRYKAMRPFRNFVMKNYKIDKVFGPHVLFRLKD